MKDGRSNRDTDYVFRGLKKISGCLQRIAVVEHGW